jgi:hypothetical protein
MKRIIFYTMVFIAFTVSSCSSSRFVTANNMSNMYGYVHLKDSRVLEGEISVSLENSFGPRDYIRFTPRQGRERQKIYIEDLEGFSLRNEFYAPKLVDEGFLSGDRMLFLKRLTREGSRIHLYELHKKRATNNSGYNRNRYGSTYYTDDYMHYISLPGQDRYKAWSITGKHLVPNFEDKMSDYVKDCPELADKIKRKEKGYFYAQVSLIGMKKIETMLNIIDEYNACK